MSERAEHPKPRSEPGLVKVRFPLPEDDQEEGLDAENLWAQDLGHNRFLIDSIPFYIYGISNRDTVIAKENDGRLQFEKVSERGGHSTYRVLIKDPAGFESNGFQEYSGRLRSLNCSYEVARHRWIAIDIPRNADPNIVYELLENGEHSGVWTFEEAHCGHPL